MSKVGQSEPKYTDAFPMLQITRPEPVKACEIFAAVYHSVNRPDVVIAAATLDALAKRWQAFTGLPLDETKAQHAIVTAWRPTDEPT